MEPSGSVPALETLQRHIPDTGHARKSAVPRVLAEKHPKHVLSSYNIPQSPSLAVSKHLDVNPGTPIARTCHPPTEALENPTQPTALAFEPRRRVLLPTRDVVAEVLASKGGLPTQSIGFRI